MEFTITAEEQKILLTLAREVITAKLEGCEFKDEIGSRKDERSSLTMPCGAFVSLHKKPEHSLRGCIGRMTANSPLIETVRLMAKEAAFGDPRFPPLKKEELSNTQIEISALSPMSPCPDPQLVKVGIHGLYLTKLGRSGVLLPQVAVEQGWNLEEYLNYICVKAGLAPGSYNAPDAQLYTFTAVVFREE